VLGLHHIVGTLRILQSGRALERVSTLWEAMHWGRSKSPRRKGTRA